MACWYCFEGAPSACHDCEKLDQLEKERRKRREAEERDFDRRMAELDAEIQGLGIEA